MTGEAEVSMSDSLFPSSLRELQRAARRVIELEGDGRLNEILLPLHQLRALPAAQALITTRAAHRSAQAALKRLHKDTVDANTAADNALRMLEATAKFKRGADAAALLRSLRDGKNLSEITSLPNADQPEAVDDYVQRMSEFVSSGQIPQAHVDEVRSTNEALRAATLAEGLSTGSRGDASTAFFAAKQAFQNRYRVFVIVAEDELGEDGARAMLVRFARGNGASEEESEDDDDTVDTGEPPSEPGDGAPGA